MFTRRLTATNSLIALTILSGSTSSVAAAVDESQLQGIALGATVVLGSLLAFSAVRDSHRAVGQQAKSLTAVSKQLNSIAKQVDTVSEQVKAARRKTDRKIELLDGRIERESSRLTLRVLGDINAARIEQTDARHETGNSES